MLILAFVLFFFFGLSGLENQKNKKRQLVSFPEKLKKIRGPLDNKLKCDLLAQVFSARVAANQWNQFEFDDVLVEYAIDETYSHNPIKEIHLLRPIFRSDSYHALVRYIVDRKLSIDIQWQNNIDELFIESFSHYALLNAQLLLQKGASPHIALPKFEDDSQSVPYYGVTQLSFKGDLKRLKLLLGYGASINIDRYDENPLINALQDETLKQPSTINMLLYYGADPHLKLKSYRRMKAWGKTPFQAAECLCGFYPRSRVLDQCYKLLKFGHARRVYRMAHYLKRLTQLPLDLTYIFAEYVYGRKVDSTDRKVWEKLSPEDYKKDRSIIN